MVGHVEHCVTVCGGDDARVLHPQCVPTPFRSDPEDRVRFCERNIGCGCIVVLRPGRTVRRGRHSDESVWVDILIPDVGVVIHHVCAVGLLQNGWMAQPAPVPGAFGSQLEQRRGINCPGSFRPFGRRSSDDAASLAERPRDGMEEQRPGAVVQNQPGAHHDSCVRPRLFRSVEERLVESPAKELAVVRGGKPDGATNGAAPLDVMAVVEEVEQTVPVDEGPRHEEVRIPQRLAWSKNRPKVESEVRSGRLGRCR